MMPKPPDELIDRGSVPVPDPTLLTTELTLREVANLKELLQSQTNGLQHEVTRIYGVLDTRHAAIRDEADRLQNLFEERFKSIDLQFGDRDKAVGAALQAQKEAAAAQNTANLAAALKSESAFTKQIDQMQMIINAIAKATDEKIDDLKTRLTLGEGTRKGIGEGWGIIVAAGGLATGILIAVAAYIK